MNAINLIVPYRYEGMWVFDDARVGLDKEPFVSGADTMIDVLVNDIPNAQKGFRLLFSATPFPGYEVKLEWVREAMAATGTFHRSIKWKVGSARHCSSISIRRRRRSSLRPNQLLNAA